MSNKTPWMLLRYVPAVLPEERVPLGIHRSNLFGIEGEPRPRREARLLLRVDTPVEVDCLRHGGVLPHVLRGRCANARSDRRCGGSLVPYPAAMLASATGRPLGRRHAGRLVR